MDATSESNGAGGSGTGTDKISQAINPFSHVTPDEPDFDRLSPSEVEAIYKDIENKDHKHTKDHAGDGNYNNQNTLQNPVYLEPGFDIYNLNSPGLESNPIESIFMSAPTVATEYSRFCNLADEEMSLFDPNMLTVATEYSGFCNLADEEMSLFDPNMLLSSNGKDIQDSPMSSSCPSGYNAGASCSSGASVVEPEFKLPARKPKRGRPPSMPVTPSREDLEKLPVEKRKKMKSNIANRKSRDKKKQKEDHNKEVRDSLKKKNERLKKMRAILYEHFRLLNEEFKRTYS